MNAGEFNRRVQIGVMTDGINPETGRDEGAAFKKIATVWAKIRHVRGSEFFQAAAVHAEKSVMFTIRYCRGITEKHVIFYDGDYYDIKAINDQSEKHEILILTCEAR